MIQGAADRDPHEQLDVWLGDEITGTLWRADDGSTRFRYRADWVERPEAVALSRSLPLQEAEFDDHACRGFFDGLLPEGDMRDAIAGALGTSSDNEYALLDAIGGECAGAVRILPPGWRENVPDEIARDPVLWLDDERAEYIFANLPERTVELEEEEGIRLSLAGAQDKLPAILDADGRIGLPRDGRPTTHILKAPIKRFEDTVVNEAFCLALADRCGVPAATASVREYGGLELLAVERFDRRSSARGQLTRIHQEDMCQALGLRSAAKYERDKGPGVATVLDVIRERGTPVPATSVNAFLAQLSFNVLIGNHDAHGKNYSMLIEPGNIRLTPAYDIVCTVAYPKLQKNMAMKIAGQRTLGQVMRRHWDRMAEESGVGAAQLRGTVERLAQRMPSMARSLQKGFQRDGLDRAILETVCGHIESRCELALRNLRR